MVNKKLIVEKVKEVEPYYWCPDCNSTRTMILLERIRKADGTLVGEKGINICQCGEEPFAKGVCEIDKQLNLFGASESDLNYQEALEFLRNRIVEATVGVF